MHRILSIIISICFIVGIWHVSVQFFFLSPLLVPSPFTVGSEMVELLKSPDWWHDTWATLYRFTAGLLMGTLGGVAGGFILCMFVGVDRVLSGCVDFFRSVPIAALIPLVMLLFGIGDNAKIVLSAFVVALLMLVQTKYGIRDADTVRLTVGRLFRWDLITRWRCVVFYEALPAVLHGFRLAISFSLIVVVVSEMIMGASYGVGTGILNAQLVYNTSEMYARIIFIGMIGFIMNMLYLKFENSALHWVGK